MPVALNPGEIFERAAREGARRLDQSFLELVATSFIAGFTIMFGIIGMGVVEGLARPAMGETANLLGALAFALGIVFLVVRRAELFSENFFNPIAAGFQKKGAKLVFRLMRLWLITLILNLVGGSIMIAVAAVSGVLSDAAHQPLNRIAEEIAHRPWLSTLMRAVIRGH